MYFCELQKKKARKKKQKSISRKYDTGRYKTTRCVPGK